jgi:hypothetical protein
MAQVVECKLSKYKAPGSNPSTAKKKIPLQVKFVKKMYKHKIYNKYNIE